MVKKILSLTVAIMLFSVTALAIVTPATLVQASADAATVSVESYPAVVDGALTGSAQLKITSATDKENLTVVTGVFSTDGEFLGAAVAPEFDLTAEVAEEKTIAMPTVSATADSKYVVNFYLWEKSTLAPLTGVTSITVQPAAPAVWDGETVTAAEDLQVATAADLDGAYTGYYMIKSGADLAGFATLVNSGTTSANAVLCNDIYLNAQTGDLTAYKNIWNGYMMGTDSAPYSGTFDGKGNTIYGMFMKNVTNNQGMFAYAAVGATIKNFTLKEVYITASATTSSSRYISPLVANATVTADKTLTMTGVTVDGGKLEVNEDKYMPCFGSFIANYENTDATSKIYVYDCHSSIVVDSSKGVAYAPTGTNYGVGGFYGRGKVKVVTADNTPIVLFEECSFTGTFNVPGTAKVSAFIARGSDSGTTYNGMTVARNCEADYKVGSTTTYSETGILSRATGEDNTLKVEVLSAN